MRKFFATRLFKVLLLGALWGSFLVFFGNYAPKGVSNIFLSLTAPVRSAIHSAALTFKEVGGFLGAIGSLKKENEQIRMHNLDLEAENALLKDMQRENALLREQLELLPRDKYALIAASILSMDEAGRGTWIEINKGEEAGIRSGMAVVVSRSILIGRVEEVYESRAKVMLLSNPKSAINVVSAQTGAKGVLKGEYGLGMIMDMVLQMDVLNKGDSIVTSGIGSEMPRGLLVGGVQQTHPSEDHLFQQAVISSPVRFSALEHVFVVKGALEEKNK